MNILFVSSGNYIEGISPIIKNQGESLEVIGHKLSYFTIKGKGIAGYWTSIFTLRRYLKQNNFDIVHAHYSLSAIVASLAGGRPVVVSLMGSDVKASGVIKYVIKLFTIICWRAIVVKSKDMTESLGFAKPYIIPNGVNFERFKPMDRSVALQYKEWSPDKKHILFASNPERQVKNFKLAQDAILLLADKNIELHPLVNTPNEFVPYYINAADVVLLTSLWEGSPNIIKEAMACGCPIVSTDVGDVVDIIGETEGCYISSYNSVDCAEKINRAMEYRVMKKYTRGRERLKKIGLEQDAVAKQITEVYQKVISAGIEIKVL